jgi:opacity protein-like surface antigen
MLRKLASVIAPILILISSSHASLTGLGIGVHGGLVSSYNNLTLEQSIRAANSNFSLKKNMPDVGIHLIVGTLRIVTLDGSLDYGWKKLAVVSGISLNYSTLSATAAVRVLFPLAAVKPYVGAGIGLYRNVYSLSGSQGAIILPANDTKVGYLAKGGVEVNIPLFPLTPFAEFRYNHVPTRGHVTHYYQVLGGITFNLP